MKEIYHSAFMQHVIFGIPMQDVQQKTLYTPGAPRKKVQGHRKGNNFQLQRDGGVGGEGSHTRKGAARGDGGAL